MKSIDIDGGGEGTGQPGQTHEEMSLRTRYQEIVMLHCGSRTKPVPRTTDADFSVNSYPERPRKLAISRLMVRKSRANWTTSTTQYLQCCHYKETQRYQERLYMDQND